MKLSRILTLIAALGLLGSAVETVPSSVQPAEVAAAQKKTAKKKKTKKSTSKSKKKSVKKTTSKSKKKSVKKTTSKPKKKSVKKITSKSKKKSVKKTTSKSKKKTLADRYKPSVRNFKEIKVGVRASSDIFIKNKESLPANTSFKFSKEPNFNKAGSYTTTIIARYSDGSKSISKPFVVVVIPKTDADLYEPTVKDEEDFTGVGFDSGSLVTNKELAQDAQRAVGSNSTKIDQASTKIDQAIEEEQKQAIEEKQKLEKQIEDEVKELDKELDKQIKTGNALNFYREQYYLSTSHTELSGGSWSDAVPEKTEGKYIWSRYVTANVGDPTVGDPTKHQYSDPVCISGLDGAQGPQGQTGATGPQGPQGPQG